MIYQVVPPDDHRHNIEEKSIKTWKYHFIGVLIGNVATFPMNLWCQLTREISINTGKITRKHKNISLCTPIWAPRLQRTTICTHWDGHFNPQETDISQNIHRALQKGICTRDILWTLPLLEPMGNWDTCNKRFSNSILLTQINHRPNCHSRRCCN